MLNILKKILCFHFKMLKFRYVVHETNASGIFGKAIRNFLKNEILFIL